GGTDGTAPPTAPGVTDPAPAPAALPPLCAADLAQARQRLEWPTPRLALGQALRGIATAAADISDGLLGDLGHILERSGKGATLDTGVALALLGMQRYTPPTQALLASAAMRPVVLQHVLGGGDDYELVFTASAAHRTAVQAAASACHTPVTRIGRIDAQPGLRLLDAQGDPLETRFQSFDHFAAKA
ncbi:MAG: thiamine-phosphate kinase, partial [Rhodoferax sp.]|nr:thiamine-phosphate kinase [Rhodoferax sp.]